MYKSKPKALSFQTRLAALQTEGYRLMPRLGEASQPMVFRDGTGGMVAILVDPHGGLWTFSDREGLVSEDDGF